MIQKALHYYQRLSLVWKLSIPLIVITIFGFLLTYTLIKQVKLINYNTYLLQSHLIPTLEKANSNVALLQKMSENFTFAIISSEKDLVIDMEDHEVIEANLKTMIENKMVALEDAKTSLRTFQDYFSVAKSSALLMVSTGDFDDEGHGFSIDVLIKQNDTTKLFAGLKQQIETQIDSKAALIDELSLEVIYYTILFVTVFVLIVLVTSYMNYRDFKNYELIEEQKKKLVMINEKVQDSIDYAALMQRSILPSEKALDKFTQQNMICWQPKDTVGGDIYFVDELKTKKEVLIMVIDGVGHGVSGGFLTMLVKAIQTQIIQSINQGQMEASPALILQSFNKTLKTMLNQERGNSSSNSGFDGGVLYYNRETNQCRYAGAKTPLYVVNNEGVEYFKSDRVSVGFTRIDMEQTYTEYEIQIKKEAKYYIATDGMIDQEGSQGGRYGKQRFREMILKNHPKHFLEQKGAMFTDFQDFKGNTEQSDDITVLGMQFI